MVKRSLLTVVIGVTASVLAGGCGGDRSSHEIQVVKDFYAAVNARDVETAMKYVAQTAVFINPTGTYRGAGAVRDFLDRHQGVTFEHTNFRVEGASVIYDFTVREGAERPTGNDTISTLLSRTSPTKASAQSLHTTGRLAKQSRSGRTRAARRCKPPRSRRD